MIQDNQFQIFFSEFVDQVKDLKSATEFCEKKRKNESPIVKLLSVTLLEIFYEIKGYLNDYEIKVSKTVGFSYEDKEEEIRTSILVPFMKSVREFVSSITEDKALQKIEQLIIIWDGYDKDTQVVEA